MVELLATQMYYELHNVKVIIMCDIDTKKSNLKKKKKKKLTPHTLGMMVTPQV